MDGTPPPVQNAVAFQEFLPNDEVARLTGEGDVQFGCIVDRDPQNNTFIVDWKESLPNSSDNEDNDEIVKLVDRVHSEGCRVRHKDTGDIGEVLEEIVLATIRLPYNHCVLDNVPFQSLHSWTVAEGELLACGGWIGCVKDVEYRCLLKYDDGQQCNITITQNQESEKSFGYTEYPKATPPHEGQRLVPTECEFGTCEWMGTGILDAISHFVHNYRGKEGEILGAEVENVNMTWHAKQNPLSFAPMPSGSIPGEVLNKDEEIVDFDAVTKQDFKRQSFCKYEITEADTPIEEDVMVDRFIKEVFKKDENEPVESPQRKRKKNGGPPPIIPEVGDICFAEVIRTRHFYVVLWDKDVSNEPPRDPNDEEEVEVTSCPCPHQNSHVEANKVAKLVIGTDLSPVCKDAELTVQVEHFYHYKRNIVLPKISCSSICGEIVLAPFKIYGVTQHCEMKSDMVNIDLYDVGPSGQTAFLERREMSRFDIKRHPLFSVLERGAVVTSKINGEIGIVQRIDAFGKVVAWFGNQVGRDAGPVGRSETHNPTDLISIGMDMEQSQHHGGCTCQPSNIVEALALPQTIQYIRRINKDLNQIMAFQLPNIQVKQLELGNISKYSVLMSGPEGTPYEDGLFLFELYLPPNYPNCPPRMKLVWEGQEASLISEDIDAEGRVTHPILRHKEDVGIGDYWKPEIALVSVLRGIREAVFPAHPLFSRSEFRYSGKSPNLAPEERKLLAESIAVNSSVLVTSLDLLLAMAQNPHWLWEAEILQHFLDVAPKLIQKLDIWSRSPVAIYADNSMHPAFHLFPLTPGLVEAFSRRADLFKKAVEILTTPSSPPAESD